MENEEIMKAAEELCDELGAVVIVRYSVSVGVKKLIGAQWYGDYVMLDNEAIEDGRWKESVAALKDRCWELFAEAARRETQ